MCLKINLLRPTISLQSLHWGPNLQSWPKCVGQSAFFPNCCNIRSLPPSPPMQCWTTRWQAFPYDNIAWGRGGGGGGGGKVGFGPKNVCFHVKNWSMVKAVHSASLSHIILARIVVYSLLWLQGAYIIMWTKVLTSCMADRVGTWRTRLHSNGPDHLLWNPKETRQHQ